MYSLVLGVSHMEMQANIPEVVNQGPNEMQNLMMDALFPEHPLCSGSGGGNSINDGTYVHVQYGKLLYNHGHMMLL
jgi:hypothetical protein